MYQSGERILLTIWIGGMWVIGYIVAPTLFSIIDERMLAGSIAGRLFTIINIIGLFCATALIAGQIIQFGKNCFSKSHWQTWILVLMLLIILIGQFILQPKMSEMRAVGLNGDSARDFARLHGVSSVLFLVNSLAGLVLVVFGVNRTKL